MVAIPGGSFTMGSPEGEADRAKDEGPPRRVTIKPFAMARDAVTVAEFRRFVKATGREMARCFTFSDKSYGKFGWVDTASFAKPGYPQGQDHPAVCISWEDAKAYITWLNDKVAGAPFRLPTEAEQEYVLRADHGAAAYPWGGGKHKGCAAANGMDQAARKRLPTQPFKDEWFSTCSDGYEFTAPVHAFPANRFGVRQLSGNVWEWGEDCWNESYKGAPKDGAAWKKGDCSSAVIRGGSWYGSPHLLRSADRFRYRRAVRSSYTGFRVARTHVE